MAKVEFESMRGVQAITMWRAFTLDGEQLTPTERAVSNLLALHYSSRSGYAYPSRETLADHLGITLRSVTRATKGLRDKKIWGVVVGRGGIYKGSGSTASSRYYPAARIIKRQLILIKDEKMREKLQRSIEDFTVIIDSFDEEEPPATIPEYEDPQADIVPEEQDVQGSVPFLGAPPSPTVLTGKYLALPPALASALTRQEADSFLRCSKVAKREAVHQVNTVVKEHGELALIIALREAANAAKVPPNKHKQGIAGWISTFGLKRIPEDVHPLYGTLEESVSFTSLLDELGGTPRPS